MSLFNVLREHSKITAKTTWIVSGWPKKSWSSTVALIIRTNCYRWPWSNPAKQLILLMEEIMYDLWCENNWWWTTFAKCRISEPSTAMIYSALYPLTCLAEWRDEVSLNATWSTFKTTPKLSEKHHTRCTSTRRSFVLHGNPPSQVNFLIGNDEQQTDIYSWQWMTQRIIKY